MMIGMVGVDDPAANFVKDKYGPYAEALNHVLQRMEGHFIRGYGDRSREASVRVLPEGSEAANNVLIDEVGTVERVQRVAELIEGFETPHGMELLASVHWVAQESVAAKIDWQEAFALVQAWNERKQRVFPALHVRAAFSQLRDLSWIYSAWREPLRPGHLRPGNQSRI